MESEATHPHRPSAGDEAAADVARETLRSVGAIPIDPDPPIAVMLALGERLLAVRHAAQVENRAGTDDELIAGVGTLFLTDRRLVLLGYPLDVALQDIRDVGVVDDHLVVLIEGRGGMLIYTDDPLVLRVEIAAARRAIRVAVGSRSTGQSDS